MFNRYFDENRVTEADLTQYTNLSHMYEGKRALGDAESWTVLTSLLANHQYSRVM
jgi:hypothetical protein